MFILVNHIDSNNRTNIYSFYLYIEFGKPSNRGEAQLNFDNLVLPDG